MWLLFGAIRLRQAEAERTLPKQVAMRTTVSQICTRLTTKHHGFTGFERGIKTRFLCRYFRKFKVALNPMYRIFLSFAKSCVLSCLLKVDNRKKIHRAVFEL